MLSFVIQPDGTIGTTSIEVIEGLFPACGKETVRVIKLFPKWTLVMKSRGKPEKVSVTIPVFFKLPGEKAKNKN